MLRYTRFLTTSLFVVLVAHVLVPGAVAQTPSPTPTPTPTGSATPTATPTPTSSATPTPTPTSSATPTPTPSGTTTPEPEPTSTSGPGRAELVVSSTATRVFAQLGGWIDYTVVVRNVGTAPAENVTVSTNVADELTVLGVPIIDGLAQQNLISIGDREQIIWIIESLPAGKQRKLPWVGQAVARGDLVAENLNAAWTDQTDSVATTRTYLGGSTTPSVTSNGAPPPAPRETITRRIVRYEPRAVTEAAPGEVLPSTGAEVSPFAVLGMLAILVGILLWALSRAPRSRLRVLGLAVAVLVAGCIGADEPVDDLTPGAASGITSATPDSVLGTRIDRDEPSGDPTPDDDDDPAPSGDDDATDPTVVADEPDTTASPGDDALVPVVTTITETVEGEREVVAAEAGPGDNLLSFDWDEASRTILSGSSSRMIRPDAVTSLVAEQVITPGAVTTRLVLTNETDDRDVRVTGRLVLEIEGALTTGARIQSPPIDKTLAPGESVSAEFVYALPSGSYSVVPSFEV